MTLGLVAALTPRLQRPEHRAARHAEAFRDLLDGQRRFIAQHADLVVALAVEQRTHLLVNLEERLRPLNEYADGEEANLDALESRMNAAGADHVARSFADYLADQRGRIASTRGQID